MLSVAVVGCGSAGGASALFAARAGHAVEVFEEAVEPRPIGAGILLQPTGLAVLARLGLLDGVLARGAPVARLRCHDARGRLVFDLRYGEVAPGLAGLGIHRGALFEALWNAVRSACGVRVHTGTAVEAIEPDGARAKLVLAGGRRAGPFDLVVVADGARSSLRDPALVRRMRPYSYGALWVVREAPASAPPEELAQTAGPGGRFVGLLPTGSGPASGDGRPLVSLFWSLRTDAVEPWRQRGIAAWKDEVARLDPRALPMVEPLGSTDEVLFATYWDVVLSRWHAGPVVFVGDAGHAMSPQLGQGANLALVDAWVLSECLAGEPDVHGALARYSRRRRAPLAYYQLASRLLTPLFQGEARLGAWLRDIGLSLASRLPFVRRRMVRTMLGVERGLIRASEPLGPIRTLLGPKEL